MSGFRLLTANKPTPSFVVEARPQSQYHRSEARVELLAYSLDDPPFDLSWRN
ncbi:hypothetical protein [Bradyrhizobium sp. CCBAU 65884]|uniref:hypothetical protein n=1 Tax=Bradyrhizobium sp. CCBAU 65884 TaxID=722477 RepID=UPI002306C3D1|nr:hypothetical protein [Bradyrhizobium sp. CCBAU 65884]